MAVSRLHSSGRATSWGFERPTMIRDITTCRRGVSNHQYTALCGAPNRLPSPPPAFTALLRPIRSLKGT